MNKTLITLIVFLATSLGIALGADAKAGNAVFDKSCKACHGPDGGGNPAMAKMMPTIPNMTTAEFQAKTDAEMKKSITEGKNKMMAQKTLAPADVDNVIAYIRTLKK